MSGPLPSSTPSQHGIIPRAILYVFEKLERGAKEVERVRQGRKGRWKVIASYLEVYNEQLRDLLNPKGSESGEKLSLRQSPDGSFFCEGCLSVECATLEDVQAVAEEAMRNRVVRAHALNADSSRSHAIFILQIEREIVLPPQTDDLSGLGEEGVQTTMRYGKLSFVDLAGSENLKQSKSSGAEAISETAAINKSLFSLGAVISLLSDVARGKRPVNSHIPFRNSVLTKLLMDSLAGKGMAMMIANVSPALVHSQETLRTLMYADRARSIKTKPTINNALANGNKDELIASLRREIKALNLENAALRNLLLENNIEIPDQEALMQAVTYTSGGLRSSSNTRRAPGQSSPEEAEWMRLNSRGGTAFKSRQGMASPGGGTAGGSNAPVYTESGELIPHEVVKRIRRLERMENTAVGQLEQQTKQVEQLQRQVQEHQQRVQEIKQQAQATTQQQLHQHVAAVREQIRAEVIQQHTAQIRQEVTQQVTQQHAAQIRAEITQQHTEKVREALRAEIHAEVVQQVQQQADRERFGPEGRNSLAARKAAAKNAAAAAAGGGLSDSADSFSASDPMVEDATHSSLSSSSSPAALHSANLSLLHANRELRRMVRLLETGPDQGKDMRSAQDAQNGVFLVYCQLRLTIFLFRYFPFSHQR